ncbi:hypothetical protein ABEB36_013887 [Hypothenemus hampei]|uniref:Uncharacterized protein n=1 Tax=Hypothenemus hampei TaxID=57062 RepID=A0ABD1E5Y3_HYPHA
MPKVYTPRPTFLPFFTTVLEVLSGDIVQWPHHSGLDVFDDSKMDSFQVDLDARKQKESQTSAQRSSTPGFFAITMQ